VGDILDLSKVEAGRMELEKVPFNLPGVLREVVTLLEVAARARGLALALDLSPNLPLRAVGDPVRLRQILTNLVGNGLKFTAAGEVRVSAWAVLPPPGPNRAWIEFSVRDTGIGIAADVQKTLFAPFAQADSSTTRKFGGTGLGLAISRLLVERMGGRIWVESCEGQGADFRFRVPFDLAAVPAVPAAGAALDEGVPVQLRGRVLVVEDSGIGQKVARLMLEALGLEVEVAADGQAALETIERSRFDLVLMDCQMPRMDGYETTRRLRQREGETGARRLPVLALTANVQPQDCQACLEAGMDGYLSKPILRPVLVARLREWLNAS
jgi:CheY-like chemotaxis protein